MEFTSLTPSSAQGSVSASNCKFSEFSEDNTSTVKLLYNSVRKCFARVSFPAKKSSRAARNGDETRPFEPALKNFAKNSLRLSFSQIIPVGVSPSGKKDVRRYREVCH